MMIGSYMDESSDTRPRGTFVVGGILGRGVPLFELEQRWEKLRKRPDIDIEYFKASECQNGWGDFAKFVRDPRNVTPEERQKLDLISHEFLNLIAHPVPFDTRSYICVQGVGIVQEDFYEVIKEVNARAILGDSPYRLAYDFAMIQCAWAMKELGNGDEGSVVYFTCDEDQEHSSVAEKEYRRLKETNPNAAKFMSGFCREDEKKCELLQTADAAAFEVRRALNLALGKWSGELRQQFNILADANATA
jgi:hypothetical protein